jgi:hypothetical protein
LHRERRVHRAMGCCLGHSVHPVVAATLRQVAFVSASVDEGTLVQFARQFDVSTRSAGEIVYSIGDDALGFYIIGASAVNLCGRVWP